MCSLQYRREKSKGAPGLAFEAWDPSNLSRRAVDQFPLETPTLLFVITRTICVPPTFPGNAEYYPRTELSSPLRRQSVIPALGRSHGRSNLRQARNLVLKHILTSSSLERGSF